MKLVKNVARLKIAGKQSSSKQSQQQGSHETRTFHGCVKQWWVRVSKKRKWTGSNFPPSRVIFDLITSSLSSIFSSTFGTFISAAFLQSSSSSTLFLFFPSKALRMSLAFRKFCSSGTFILSNEELSSSVILMSYSPEPRLDALKWLPGFHAQTFETRCSHTFNRLTVEMTARFSEHCIMGYTNLVPRVSAFKSKMRGSWVKFTKDLGFLQIFARFRDLSQVVTYSEIYLQLLV